MPAAAWKPQRAGAGVALLRRRETVDHQPQPGGGQLLRGRGKHGKWKSTKWHDSPKTFFSKRQTLSSLQDGIFKSLKLSIY